MPPGPELSALLATVDPTRLHGWQLVDLLDARNRQVAVEHLYEYPTVEVLARALESATVAGNPVTAEIGVPNVH